jgi:hypothetical protein
MLCEDHLGRLLLIDATLLALVFPRGLGMLRPRVAGLPAEPIGWRVPQPKDLARRAAVAPTLIDPDGRVAPLSSTQSGPALGLHPRQKFALLPPLGPAAGRASDEVEMQSELAVNLRYEPGSLSPCDFGAEPAPRRRPGNYPPLCRWSRWPQVRHRLLYPPRLKIRSRRSRPVLA